MATTLPMADVSLMTESCLELPAASVSTLALFFCRCATIDRAVGSSYLGYVHERCDIHGRGKEHTF